MSKREEVKTASERVREYKMISKRAGWAAAANRLDRECRECFRYGSHESWCRKSD